MMLFRLGEIIVLPIAWAALVLGSLQSKLLVSASAHSVCGPWGCGPETAALVAMHAGWLAVIGPPLIYFPMRLKWQKSSIRRLALGLMIAGLAGVLAIVAWQWFVWLPQAGAWSKDYIWQRCGFAIVTAVDWPLIPLLILSGLLWIITVLRRKEPINATSTSQLNLDGPPGTHFPAR
jgi:TRAP-type C4-dicarboxylate transport system permease large subunit